MVAISSRQFMARQVSAKTRAAALKALSLPVCGAGVSGAGVFRAGMGRAWRRFGGFAAWVFFVLMAALPSRMLRATRVRLRPAGAAAKRSPPWRDRDRDRDSQSVTSGAAPPQAHSARIQGNCPKKERPAGLEAWAGGRVGARSQPSPLSF